MPSIGTQGNAYDGGECAKSTLAQKNAAQANANPEAVRRQRDPARKDARHEELSITGPSQTCCR